MFAWTLALHYAAIICIMQRNAKCEMLIDRKSCISNEYTAPTLHALTNVRQRHWFTLLANLISFIRFKVRTKFVSFEVFAVIASLHMVNDGFHLPTFPVCSLKMCNACAHLNEFIEISTRCWTVWNEHLVWNFNFVIFFGPMLNNSIIHG